MDTILYGSDSEENIIAVHPASDQTMRVYLRKEGKLASDEVSFFPFFFLTDPSYLKKFEKHYWIKELQGTNPLRFIAAFGSWSDMWEGVRSCLMSYNETAEIKAQSYQDLPVIYVRPDPVAQYLKQSGKTLFKNMIFASLHRMQIDIVTLMKRGSAQSNPERPDDQIVAAALSDNRGWQHAIQAKRKNEKALLIEIIKLIKDKDPDIIEGLFATSFIIPYIIARCRLHGIDAVIGRDGSVPSDQRPAYAERSITAGSALIAGRHVVDIHNLHESTQDEKLQPGYSVLKKMLFLSGRMPDMPETASSQLIPFAWENEQDKITGQCLKNVSDIRYITDRLLPRFISLANMLPFNLAPVTRLNPSGMVDSLVHRCHIHRKLSMPRPVMREHTPGDLSEIFAVGIYSPVIVLDVKAIISSLILDGRINPVNDTNEIYLHLLSALTANYRKISKTTAGHEDPAAGAGQFSLYEAYSTLISASADYFLNSRSRFYDPSAVDHLLSKTQNIIREITASIHSLHGSVVQTGIDGIFFIPPAGISEEEDDSKLIEEVANALPDSVILRKSGRYKSMLSYKKKNYALLHTDGRISINGTNLIPRTTEGFGKRFLSKCLEALLKNDIARLHDVYMRFHRDIAEHRFNPSDFQKSETLTLTKDEYLEEIGAGKRHRTASYETAIRSGLKWSAGDKISYYLSGDDPNPRNFDEYKLSDDWDSAFPDDNIPYYLKRLVELARKFDIFFTPQDFHSIFSAEDLFGFSARGKTIINSRTEMGEFTRAEDDADALEINPKIWLDI